MNNTIDKVGVVKRTAKKLNDKRIVIGGNKVFYKRKYHLKYSQEIVENVLNAFLDVIPDILEEGDTIKMLGYLQIEPRFYRERKIRKIAPTANDMIPARYRPKIKPYCKLIEACERIDMREMGKCVDDDEA